MDELLEQEASLALESSTSVRTAHWRPLSLCLLRRFRNNMSAVADHLRISRSYACAAARTLDGWQLEVTTYRSGHRALTPLGLGGISGCAALVQLAFDFDDELAI
ncbi:MAG: hypothetical protein U1F17_06585 [Burkholderiaceae bacterium]